MDGTQGMRQRGGEHHVNMAEIALRGTALLFDIQMEAARNMMQMQARTATALGAPDYSDLFRMADDRAKRLFSTGAEQILNSARQANETVAEMQRQIGRLMEQQTVEITEEMRQGIEELGRHTQEGLQQVRQVIEQEAEEAQRAMRHTGNGEQQREQAGQLMQQAASQQVAPSVQSAHAARHETEKAESRARRA